LISSPIAISGDFSEDFSDPILEGWLLYGTDSTWGSDWFVQSNNTHTWGLIDDTLVSAGSLYSRNINLACHQTDVNPESSIWEFDMWGNNERWRFGFMISEFPTVNDSGNYRGQMPSIILDISAGLGFTGQNETPAISIGQYYYSLDPAGTYSYIESITPDDSQLGGWHHYRIERNDNDIKVIADDIQLFDVELWFDTPNPCDSICMYTEMGSGIKVDNIKAVSQDDNGGILTNPFFWGGIIAITMMGSAGFVTRNYLKKKGVKSVSKLIKQNREIINQVKQEFNLTDPSLFTLVSGVHRVDERYKDQEFKNQIPQELLTYRYLMHPIRLAILKLLAGEDKMRSVEIKHILDISWGEYSNHINSLEEKGYVELVDEFNEDGHVSQTAYIMEAGRIEFFDLLELLKKFIADQSPYGNIIQEDKFSFKDDESFPIKLHK
jgi:DNA-binding transcriptional ArsR family regulator